MDKIEMWSGMKLIVETRMKQLFREQKKDLFGD